MMLCKSWPGHHLAAGPCVSKLLGLIGRSWGCKVGFGVVIASPANYHRLILRQLMCQPYGCWAWLPAHTHTHNPPQAFNSMALLSCAAAAPLPHPSGSRVHCSFQALYQI